MADGSPSRWPCPLSCAHADTSPRRRRHAGRPPRRRAVHPADAREALLVRSVRSAGAVPRQQARRPARQLTIHVCALLIEVGLQLHVLEALQHRQQAEL